MDDSWRSKCSAAPWHPPPAPPRPPPSMAPSPLHLSAAVTPALLAPAAPPHASPGIPAPGPIGQVGINLNQHFHSFIAQGDRLSDQPNIQDTMTCKTPKTDSSKLGKLEPVNSFLALLSGELPRVSNLKPPQFAKLHINSNDAVIDPASCRLPSRNIESLPRNQGTGSFENWNEISPFAATRSSQNSSISRAPSLHLRREGSLQDASVRLVPQQASQANTTVLAASSIKHKWTTSVQQENSDKHHSLNVQASQEVPSTSKCSTPFNSSPFLRGHPRVVCRDTVGELFMSDMGLFGVVCLCHNSHMSLAKFCEHSGVPRANPGEVVHLENGMTISDWCKQCLGMVAIADSKRWEGSESFRVNDMSSGSKVKRTSSLLDSIVTVRKIEESGVSEISGKHSNSSAYNGHPQIKAALEILQEIPGDSTQHSIFQGYNLDGHSTVHKKPPSLTKVALTKNHSMQAVKQIPVSIDYQKAHSTVNKGKDVVRQQPENCNVHYRAISSNNSINYPCPWTKSSTHGYDISIGNLTNKASPLNKNGATSNIELELRQPSQKNYNFADSFPTSVLQFGTLSSNSQKKQLNQQLNQADNSGETEKTRSSFNFPFGASCYDRNNVLHAVGTVNAVDHPESDASAHDATKNSLISLFLSHLERNNTSQSLDTLLNNSEHSFSRMGNDDSISAKPSLRDSADENERKHNACTLGFPENLDGRKIVQSFNNDKMTSNCTALNNRKTNNREITSSINGLYLQGSSFTESSSRSLYDQPSGLRQNPCVKNQHRKAFFISNKDFCDHAVHKSSNQVSIKMDPLSVRSDVSTSPSSATLCSVKPNSSWPNKRTVDMTKDFTDENWKYCDPNHVVEFSKQEKPTDSVKRNPENQRLCHLSPREHQANAIQRDFAVPVLVREAPQCNSHQDVSEFTSRPWPFCRSVPTVDRGDAAAHRGSSRCCSCIGSTEMVSLGPEHNGKSSPTCHICDMDDRPCLRLGRLSDQCINDDCKQEMCKQKEHVSEKYFSAVHSHCVSGCCIIGANNTCSTFNKRQICVEAKAKHMILDCEKDYLLPECKRIRVACILRSNDISSEEMAHGQAKPKNVTADYKKNCSLPDCNKICQDYCDCSKNDILSRNDHQTAMWRDVPEKDFANTNSSLADRITQAIETMKVVDDQLNESPAKYFNGTDQECQLIRAQQMSNVSSESSVPVITEVSVDNNNAISQAPNVKVVTNFIVDEGSGIEKCDSSDEAHGSRGYDEVTAFSGKAGSAKSRFQCFQSDLSGNSCDELYSKSQTKCKRDNNLEDGECPSEENNSKWQKFGRISEVGKRNNSVRWNKINVLASDFPANHPGLSGSIAQSKIHFSPSEGIEVSGQHNTLMQKLDSLACQSSSVKRKRSVFSSSKSRLDSQNKVSECDEMQTIDDCCSIGRSKNTRGKRRMQDLAAFSKEKDAADAAKPPKYVSLNCILNTPTSCKTTLPKKTKPVVCGNSGIIFNKGDVGQEKPAKILPLSVILKKARRCSATDIYKNAEPTISSDTKNACLAANNREGDASFYLKSSPENKDSNQSLVVDSNPGIIHSSGEVQGSPSKKDGSTHDPPKLASKTTCESSQSLKSDFFPKILRTKSRQKYIDIRSSSPVELIKKGRCTMKSSIGTNKSGKGIECKVSELCTGELSGDASPNDTKSVTSSKNYEDHSGKLSQQSTRICKQNKCFKMNSDAFCCVCGSSNQEDVNQLLECSGCLIRVHQACYGVSKIPKGHWQCRPCKTGSKNIVCVLCGYDGGAMTRALRSQNIVKSLLKAWKMVKVPDSIKSTHSSEIQNRKDKHLKSSVVDGSSKSDKSGSVTVVSSICLDSSPRSALEKDLQKHTITTVLENCIPEDFQFFNSIAAGVFDPCGIHWVHMVCGLWTPGTRCPNVDTMSAFDVSGASPAKKNSICSICNRPGGSCIICRNPNCNITFHPWCAHQKGLLQSEIEGDDADKVGFYGRCVQHAMINSVHLCADKLEENPGNKEITCARAEGFKGRRRENVFQPTKKSHSRRGECIVSQEQINAWLHINGQKFNARWTGKLPCFDVEHDFRKEYIRYKQSKGWKNFVVYKSGIHALGLYTSQFIPRGAMVVEYIGEIVGLRVADKREIEYQSGRRMQYKSACYFFRLDKEHIIDATRKGGIARFVNHSCLPNCVAKIISIRNEKKVVFFAERNINPGEEITYDYHFNSEDEGKKIPCFCKSKNCRRYLN